jgi:hypothetical protein
MLAVLMRTSSAEVRAREAQRLLEYGEDMRERLSAAPAAKTRRAASVVAKSGTGGKRKNFAFAGKEKDVSLSETRRAGARDGRS